MTEEAGGKHFQYGTIGVYLSISKGHVDLNKVKCGLAS